MPSTLSKIQGCLMGVAIGDAMGMPWETMTPEEIKTETGDRGVQGFSAPVQKRISGTASHNAGDTTDDWQLTHAIARSLIRQKKFDIEDIAREHVVEFDRSVKGWGGTTKTSVRKIKEWFETSGKRGINPSNPAHIHRVGQGSGNGVAMKVAPLGIFFNHDDDALCNAVWSVGALTHTDDRAWITAYLTAYVISTSLYGENSINVRENDSSAVEQFVVTLLGSALGLESQDVQEPGVFKQCDKLLALVTSGKLFKDATIARKTFGTGCLCVESVPFAIATFLRHPTDFRAGVLEAVNAGGDTDSTASMVGAMIGANVGLAGIPEDWQIGPEREDALRLGVALHALVRKQ